METVKLNYQQVIVAITQKMSENVTQAAKCKVLLDN